MLPCKEVHWKILPAILRNLAIALDKEAVSQRKIARLLGTTPAAVSQYISGKRGAGRLPLRASAACKRLAKKIAGGKAKGKELEIEIAKIVVLAKNSRLGKKDPCAICAGG